MCMLKGVEREVIGSRREEHCLGLGKKAFVEDKKRNKKPKLSFEISPASVLA